MNNNLKRYIEITRQSKLTDFEINFYDEIGIKTINDFKKSEEYQAISDMSKELHGSRLRLDIDEYSLKELEEMTSDFASQIIERNDRRANKSTEDFVNNKLLAESLGVTIEDLERWEVAY
tara:strand:- start:133 stop:492 length:360 start_codon:yes stop_codon:yes gene_type:complete